MATVQVSFYTKTRGWKRDLIEIATGRDYDSFVSSTIPTPSNYFQFVYEFIEHFNNTNRICEEAIRHSINSPFEETRDNPIYTYTKVSLINDNYSTYLSSAEKCAISKILYDYSTELQEPNYNSGLITEIRDKCKKDKIINKDPYSFITKYCCHHNPNYYPIYDSYVDIMLKWYSDLEQFPFTIAENNMDFSDYDSFCGALEQFKECCEADISIESISFRDIDKFLWSAGKSFFNPYINKEMYENYKNNPALY